MITDLEAVELYLAKGREWAHEREWRIAKDAHDADRSIETKVGQAHLFSLEPDAVKVLVLGARSSEETLRKATVLLERPEWAHIELQQAHLHESEYQLVLEKVV